MRFKLEHISYSYSKNSHKALKDISISFPSDEICAVAGENGSGKTTLINIMMGRLHEYTGTYAIDDHTIDEYTGNFIASHKIGFSSDHIALDDSLTGMEILELVSEIRGCTAPQFQSDIAHVKEFLHIGDWADNQPCDQYSMGMRKKISIAAAYVGGTQFVILDEPLNGLDPLSIYGLQKYILKRKNEGVGLLIATHILDFAEKITSKLLLLKNGEAIFSGTYCDLVHIEKKRSLSEIYFNLYMRKNGVG